MTEQVKLEKVQKAPKKRKIASLDKRKARVGWFFVLPFLLGFVLIYLPMLFDSFKLAFSDMTTLVGGGVEFEFTGLENFQYALFTDAAFVQTLISGLGQLVFEVPAILLFSLYMAILLNQKMVGRAAFRAIFFLPVVLATGIMESIEAGNILGSYMGETSGIDDGSGSSAASEIVSAMDFETLFKSMKVGTELVDYVVQIILYIADTLFLGEGYQIVADHFGVPGTVGDGTDLLEIRKYICRLQTCQLNGFHNETP
jgi:hypothetical protein